MTTKAAVSDYFISSAQDYNKNFIDLNNLNGTLYRYIQDKIDYYSLTEAEITAEKRGLYNINGRLATYYGYGNRLSFSPYMVEYNKF